MFIRKQFKFVRFFSIVVLHIAIVISIASLNSSPANALTVLAPGQIYVIRANSDFGFPGGAGSNGFDFVSTVDLDPGTEIFFTDKGWDGSLGSPFWRNTTGEGALRYTVPIGGISAGTIVSFDDSLISSLPTSGSSTWDMFSIDPTTGAMSLTTAIASGFDPATTGDNILVFQGSAASPNFLYGVGWSGATTWISSGTPSANNSWIPAGISTAANTVVTLGSTDNFRYNCLNLGIFSSNFASDLVNAANWTADNTNPFAASNCVFDVTQPFGTITQNVGQNDPTNNSDLNFVITFDQAINPASFTTGDIGISGTGSATINSVTTLDNIVWIINLTATSEGTIIISLPSASVSENSSGNLNISSIYTDNIITYDASAPMTLATPDLVASSDSGTFDNDNITNDTTPEFSGTCTTGDTIQIFVDASPVLPSVICVGGTYSITLFSAIAEGNYDIQARATDAAGNSSSLSSSLEITIDTTAPSCNANNFNGFDTSPAFGDNIDDPNATTTLTIDGNTYNAIYNAIDSRWEVAQGEISPALTTSLTPNEVYPFTVTCNDVAGNTFSRTRNYTLKSHIDLSINVVLNTTGKILSGQNIVYTSTIQNVNPSFNFNLDNLFVYHLVPNAMTVPSGVFSTSNSNVSCENLGATETVGGDYAIFPGNHLIRCEHLNGTSLTPGDTFSYQLSFVANMTLPNLSIFRSFIYDDPGNFDPHSTPIEQDLKNGINIFSTPNNSISEVSYSFVDPITTTTTTAVVIPPFKKPAIGNLPSTGAHYVHQLFFLAGFLLCLGTIIIKRTQRRFRYI